MNALTLQSPEELSSIVPTASSIELAEVMFHHFPLPLLERIGFDEQDGMVEVVSRLITFAEGIS